ncbi:MAG TPA: hypothetical protein PLS60_00150, partial [Arenimonas sp.]|nr:hypothetical protein [Arenimonas sp.]
QNNPYANPYAAPQSSIYSPPPLPQQEELVDRGMRLIAAILDSVLYVFSMVPGMIFRSDQRCLHDLVADTIMIKA